MVVKSIKPLFSTVITTADVFDNDVYEKGVIVANKGELKEHQKVVAVGEIVRNVTKGDLVHIDPTRYKVVRHDTNSIKNDNIAIGYNIPTLEINGKKYLKLQSQDLDYVVDDYEEDDNIIRL